MSHRTEHLSDQAVPPPDVHDVLLWRLAIDVAAAHQPDDHGNCRNLACSGQAGICPALHRARQALRAARTPQPSPIPAPARIRVTGRATVPTTGQRPGRFVGWFATARSAMRTWLPGPCPALPHRVPGATLAAA